ncbi:Neutral/alkaline nonlysosomal ceramidase [Radiomyces spectabilis]|uniref:Neutral/alkaline nonlysosomal ceramidase n=1 Tax=Radiomyces spectabilis TaxID=64574 RepID=UPI00221EFE3E|nr:Neutral/alkaline nonlysosomal ceramidase [Radiomyces spectabilis]KAI8369329.1 Neutral/alkaline nonlysosomal ceramidase [Radiomyces spectabilis]
MRLLLFLFVACTGLANALRLGTGIADITGPIVDIMLMGYAKSGQTGVGILQRLWARAFIIMDDNENRIAFVNIDTQSVSDIVKQRVVQGLLLQLGDNIYNEKNLMISSTHSHSGMGGYLQYTLYELSVFGWIEETVQPMVQGIVNAILRAHHNLEEGILSLSVGELLDTNINRSPSAYLLNPAEERAQYSYDVDKDMTVMKFRNAQNENLGLISWFAVHGVSINNTNRLINGDNKGYAAYLAEKTMNPDSFSGKGRFVAAFAQSNEGDVSPNTLGAYYHGTDIPCDGSRDGSDVKGKLCYGRGPGWLISDYESNRIIGQNQAYKALDLFDGVDDAIINGPVDFRQKYWDITQTKLKAGRVCKPAMGYAFAAGTTDGPALRGFYQNTTQGTVFWDLVRNALYKPSEQQVLCQQPKPILLDTGEIPYPYEWQPRVLDVQLFRIGKLFIIATPSELTTMSGRRLRKSVKDAIIEYGLGGEDTIVIYSGPANSYASYCTTKEEYQMQRYEGASTPYGPHTLEAYMEIFKELVYEMATNSIVDDAVRLPNFTNYAFNLSPRHGADVSKPFHQFGDVVRDVDLLYDASINQTVSAVFVAGNPRNDAMLDKTFLTVERKDENDNWIVIRTDDDYDTRFLWRYTYKLIRQSEATIEWDIGNHIPSGTYRLGYFGHHMAPFTK